MIIFWLTFSTVIAGLALLVAFLLACQSWEHRRSARKRLQASSVRSLVPNDSPRVALFAPCKGLDVGLKENLRPLFCQDYGNYELHFVVESVDDPACSVIGQLMAEYPKIKSNLVVAGKATDTGQKVHGLRAATDNLVVEIELLAFVDSDARPHCQWLSLLLRQLGSPGVGIVTGYRWFVPQQPTWTNYLLHSINATAASLYSPKGLNPVWGGSWAIRRDLFDRIGLRDVWNGVLTDDLVATNLVRQAGFRVAFEPACVLASPLDFTFGQMFQFLRRQYMIGRHYMPGMWILTLLATTLTVVGFWGALAAAAVGVLMHTPGAWWPASACAILYGWGMYRASIRRDLAHLYLPGQRRTLAPAIGFDFLLTPLSTLLNWAAILTTVWSRTLVWREITYRLLPRGKTCIVHRSDETRPLVVFEHRQAGMLGTPAHGSTADSRLPQREQELRPHRDAA
jgi:hypothetical protein